ncbi:MAG: hypothetical protein ABSC48_02930 [Terracidiphilus sp.]|jgi:hypothetical protein
MQINELSTRHEVRAHKFLRGSMNGWRKALTAAMLAACASGTCLAQWAGTEDAFLPSPVRTISTVPANGDVNPYGVAFVPNNFITGSGQLKHGDILVSNFNNSTNVQGTGTTIVRVPASGPLRVFFEDSKAPGLSTALGTLQYGFVVVGICPDIPSTQAAGEPGSLLVINNQGRLAQTITSKWIQAPWDMALVDRGDTAIAFVANALNGTISRLNFNVSSSGLTLESATTIASGYVNRPDPVTFFVAPTGLLYDASRDVLYVASTGDNLVFGVTNATHRKKDDGMGFIAYDDNVHLHGPLGLAAAPNGHLLVTNSDGINSDPNQPSEIVEFTKQGEFVKELSVDPAQGGSFGLAVSSSNGQSIFAAVDDNTSSLLIWTLNE